MKMLKAIEKQGFKEGVCPFCNSIGLDYGAVELETGFLFYLATCRNCGATGREYYNIEFTDIIMKKEKK